MSIKKGRPQASNRKNVRLEIRLTQEQSNILTECSKKMNCTKTDTILKGIEYIRSELEKNKTFV